MNENFLFYPDQASSHAAAHDALFWALMGVTIFFSVLIFVLIVIFAIKYRRRTTSIPRPEKAEHGNNWIEIVWTGIPLVIGIGIFYWGTVLFLQFFNAGSNDSMQIFVLGKQWMWKFQHPDGRRENNELHVPIGQPVRLLMISQDVIHSVGIPAFRIKHDVLPMRYTSISFTPIKPGKYHLYCNQYCGTDHSLMVGWVYAMTPDDYQQWLAGGVGGALPAGNQADQSPAEKGKAAMENLGCFACHGANSTIGPKYEGVFGHQVTLADGKKVTADENYIRESILNPTAKIVAGFQPVMPPFQGRVSEQDLINIIAYIKSLGNQK